MRSVEVVVLQPRREMLIAFLGVEVMANVGPLAQSGLNEAFGLAVGARGEGQRNQFTGLAFCHCVESTGLCRL
jgi:hypothetical protein